MYIVYLVIKCRHTSTVIVEKYIMKSAVYTNCKRYESYVKFMIMNFYLLKMLSSLIHLLSDLHFCHKLIQCLQVLRVNGKGSMVLALPAVSNLPASTL